jgi:hypothetical protein
MDSIETGNAGPVEPDKPRTPSRRKTKAKETVVGSDAPHWTSQPPPVALTAQPGTAKPTTAPKPRRLENPKSKAIKAANEQLVVAYLDATAQRTVLASAGTQIDRDTALFQQVGRRATVLMSRGSAGSLTRDEAMNMSTDDIAAIGAIQDRKTRKIALVAVAEIRKAQPFYKAEFDRQAPSLAIEAEAAATLMTAPRSPENERAYWLSKRADEAALDAMTNSIEPAPARTAAPNPGGMASVAHDTTELAKEIVAGPALTLKDAGQLVAELPPAPPFDRSTAIPEAVAKRFLKVDNDYFFPSEKTPAFIDRDTKLATRGENRIVINSMVEVAKARGWNHITVGGTEEFRREAWLAASLVGIQVDGYKPTELDKADLARRPSGNSISQAAERIMAEPPPLILSKSAEQAAPLFTTEQMADLRIKASSFANEKPSFVVKKYPDLAAAYGTLSAAAMFAAEHLPGNADRFAKVTREALVDMIARGETVPAPDLIQGANKAPMHERGRSKAKGDELQR